MDKSKLIDLLSKYDKGTCTKEELVLLYRFFDAFQDDNNIWDTKGIVEKERIRKELSKKIKQRIDFQERNRKSISPLWKVAAAILFVIGLGAMTKMLLFQKEQPIEYERIVSNDMGIKEVALMDGSTVWLNRNSELVVAKKFMESEFREVTLHGEAFFEVAKNKNRPFIVHSSGFQTKVLGTKFNVKESNERTDVALIEGSVEVNANAEQVLLKPMEKAVFGHGNDSIAIVEMDMELELAWMTNDFDFKNTKLSRVATMLERRFHKKITFEQSGMAEKKVTGHYENESLNAILLSVTQAGNLDYKYNDKQHILIFKPLKNNSM